MAGTRAPHWIPAATFVVGVVATTVGMGLLSWADVLDYYDDALHGQRPQFVPALLRQIYTARGEFDIGLPLNPIVTAYSGWLCWVLLVLTVAAGLSVMATKHLARLAAGAAAGLAFVGLALTLVSAVLMLHTPANATLDPDHPHLSPFRSLLAGPWVTAIGFLLMGVAVLQTARRGAEDEAAHAVRGSVRVRTVTSSVSVGCAVVCLFLAINSMAWYTEYFDHDSLTTYHFRDLGDPLSRQSIDGHGIGIVARAYFPVLGTVLAVAAVLFALAALIRTTISGPLRVLGGLAGAGGVVTTLIVVTGDVIRQIVELPGYHPEPGVVLMIVGFALAAIACLVAPPGGAFVLRRRDPSPSPSSAADDALADHPAAVG